MEAIVDNQNKVLIFWNAKCGCSFVKSLFIQSKGREPSDFEDIHTIIGYGYPGEEYSYVNPNDLTRYDSYKKVLVVRDPYKRLVSGFLEKIPKWIKSGKLEREKYSTFKDFIIEISKTGGRVISDNSSFVDEHHFIPQFSEKYKLVESANWKFDYVIDVTELSKKIGLFESLFNHELNESLAYDWCRLHKVEYSNQMDLNAANTSIDTWMNATIFPSYKSFFADHETVDAFRNLYSNDLKKLKELGFEYSL